MPNKKLKSQNSNLKTTTQNLKTVKKTKGLSIDVFDTKGKVVEKIQLPKEIFGAEVNKTLLAQAVRVYLMNNRAGNASTKTRGEVTGSTRKIYRQKGTGRARHGGIRAPIFVHGGIAHGPKPIDFSRSFTKNMKRQALFCALSATLQNGGLTVIAGLEKLAPKTKAMVATLEKLSLLTENKRPNALLLVEPKDPEYLHRITRNITGVTSMQALQLNAYVILQHKHVLMAKEAVEILKQQII